MRKRANTLIAALAVLGLLASCGGDSEGEPGDAAGGETTIQAGAIFDTTGPFSSLGQDQEAAFEIALDEVNSGDGGARLSATVENSETSVDRAVELARQFIAQDVDVIFGPTSNAACQAVQQVTERAGVTTYCYTGGPVEVTPHVFAGQYPPEGGLAGLPLKYFESQGWRTVGCLRTADASGQSYSEPLKALAPQYGIEIVAEETFQPGATDVVPQLTTLRQADPDVLYACASGANVVPIARGVRQLGWDVPVFAGLGALNYEVIEAVSSFVPEGGIFSNGSPVMVPDQVPEDYPGRELVRSFHDKFTQATDKLPSPQAGDTYDSVRLVVAAAENVREAGLEINGDTIAEQLEQTTDFPGTISTYNFAPDRHRGTSVPLFTLEWTEEGTAEIDEQLDSLEPAG